MGEPDGATGGGYILSKGTESIASFDPSSASSVSTVVDGDPSYDARTTRRALELLAESHPRPTGSLILRQVVGTPIGSGFGASGASAVSGVYAAAAASGIRRPKRELAMHAHRAEIIEGTGLGTVSVVYDAIGAGAIVTPGEPGVAQFRTVKVPRELRIVSASLAPYHKRDALGSKSISERVNRLGGEALSAFVQDPTLETLATQGERFSAGLGLETPEVQKLIATARSNGATAASQNMLGYAIHALTDSDRADRVASALAGVSRSVRVDIFHVGKRRAAVGSVSHR